MFSKTATANFVAARPTQAQRRSAVAVRAGPYDAELIQTAVSAAAMRGWGGSACEAYPDFSWGWPAHCGGLPRCISLRSPWEYSLNILWRLRPPP